MSVTKTDVLLIAPELSTLSDSQWTQILGFCDLQLNATYWGTSLDMGKIYLAAHLATVGPKSGGSSASGSLTGETVGQVSRTYAAPMANSATDESLESTSYGRQYKRLIRLLRSRGWFTS